MMRRRWPRRPAPPDSPPQPGQQHDDLCRDGVGAIIRLLADGGELVTVVSAADVGGRIAAELAASRPDIDVNQLTVDELDSVVWIGVE